MAGGLPFIFLCFFFCPLSKSAGSRLVVSSLWESFSTSLADAVQEAYDLPCSLAFCRAGWGFVGNQSFGVFDINNQAKRL